MRPLNPTITVQFDKPAEVHSLTLPRDKTPNGNVQQFEVTFYSPYGNKINDIPILSDSSPKEDKSKPAKNLVLHTLPFITKKTSSV
ncbi:unnamed protein product [Rotaria sp. Silwood1]|nr:unnamed protein product [Rotaria sp. Silwood1]